MKNANAQAEYVLTNADHLVGNLWFDLESVPFIANIVGPDQMRQVAPGAAALVYSEMCRLLRSSSEPLSAGALEANLKAQGFDFAWLYQVQARVQPREAYALENYAKQVVNASNLRKIQVACHRAQQDALEAHAEATTVAGELMAALAENDSKGDGPQHVGVAAGRVRQQFANMQAGNFDWGSKTGFADLDRIFRLVDGDYITLGGRPSQGKTSLARQIAFNRARQLRDSGEPGQVVFFSIDDTADKLISALACGMARVDSNLMRQGKLSGQEWQNLEVALAEIESVPLFIDETHSPSVDTLHYRCALLNAKAPIKLAVCDYHGLIRHPDHRADELKTAEYASTGCKEIARTFKFPWLMLSQLRKDVDSRADKVPTPADARYAGEAESDVMMFIMRPEHYLNRGETCDHKPGDEKGVAVINIGKNKTGQIGKVRLAFIKEWSYFFDLVRTPLNEAQDD
jgi:replicative DNA helicase